MPKHPPIDAAFFEWGVKVGMTEDQIAEDWMAYCEGLEAFHEETTMAVLGEPTPVPSFCVGGSE